jgi:hypothetical protein
MREGIVSHEELNQCAAATEPFWKSYETVALGTQAIQVGETTKLVWQVRQLILLEV